MKLHLTDGTEIEIFRQNCGHYIPRTYSEHSCNWNINPVEIINENNHGYFAIGKWGCDGHWDDVYGYVRTPEKFEQLIPVRHVVRITELDKWEKPDEG